MEFRCGQVTLDIFDPSSIGQPFAPRAGGHRASCARRRRGARRSSRRRASSSTARRSRRACAARRGSRIPTGTRSCCTGGSTHDPRRARSSAIARFRFRRRRTSTGASRTSRASIRTPGRPTARRRSPRRRRCSSSTRPASRTSGRRASRSCRRRRASASSALPEDHELLYSLVGWDEKFAAHNAAMWTNGLLVHVPRGVVAREAALRPHRELGRGRVALLAAARRRRAREPLHADRGVRVGDP